MHTNKKNMFFSNITLQKRLAGLSETRSISPFSLLSSPKKINEVQTFDQISPSKGKVSVSKAGTSPLIGLVRRRSSFSSFLMQGMRSKTKNEKRLSAVLDYKK
jgi:hypothetical protein